MSIFEINWFLQGLSYKLVFKWALNKQGVTHIFRGFQEKQRYKLCKCIFLQWLWSKSILGWYLKTDGGQGLSQAGAGFKPGQPGLRPFWSRITVYKRGGRRSSASRAPTSIRWVQSTPRKARIQLSQKPSLLVKRYLKMYNITQSLFLLNVSDIIFGPHLVQTRSYLSAID